MVKITLSDAIDKAWELTKRHGLLLVVIYFLINLITQSLSRMFTPPIDADLLQEALQDGDIKAIFDMVNTNPTATIVISILGMVLSLGFVNLLLCFAKETISSVTIDAWKLPAMTYVKYIVVGWIVNILSVIGLIFCIIPGIYIYVRLQFAQLRIIEHPEVGIMESLSESWNMTTGNVLNLIWLAIACFFIIIVGLCCCCVGILPAAVLCSFVDVVAYLILSGWYNRPKEETVNFEQTLEA